ncbi:hypothetical protein ABPG75_007402 [Micractinium tetrahymenae]
MQCGQAQKCESATCTTAAASCSDGKRNGQEVDVDCGGICPGCGPGKMCNSNSDCQSGLSCLGGTCTASTVDCTGQCGTCGANQECAARSGNTFFGPTSCACYCKPGFCNSNNDCQAASSSSCNFNALANGGPGASYQCGSLPGSSGSSCLQGSSCVQTGPTTYQCLPTDSKCPPQGCPVGTYCSSGRCICNGVTDPSTVTSCASDQVCENRGYGSYLCYCPPGTCYDGSKCVAADAQHCGFSGFTYPAYQCTSTCTGGQQCVQTNPLTGTWACQ